MRDKFTEPQGPRPSDVELLARELEGMAQHATSRDHGTSPIVDTIRQAPSARPFVGALRILVERLTGDGQVVPHPSVVVRLVRECDLDAAVKLELLQKFLRCSTSSFWKLKRREELAQGLKRGDEPVAAALLDVLRAGGSASLDTVVGWLGDERHLASGAAMAEAAEHLLHIVADEDPDAVFDALAPMPSTRALIVLAHLARLHPDDAMAFARCSIEEGAFYQGAVALAGLETCEPMREEVGELATSIASDPRAGGVRTLALKVLLVVSTTVAPNVWEMIRAVPHQHWDGLPLHVGTRVRDGLLEPLAVLEQWMRTADVPEWPLGELCIAFGMALDGSAGSRLSGDVQERVVADLAEAWRRGARASDVAHAVAMALRGRSDPEYSSLGLEELARALAATDSDCRRHLLYAVAGSSSRDAKWRTRLLRHIADASDFHEKVSCVSTLARGFAHPDRWSESEIERLLTECEPGMSREDAASACLRAIPGDGVVDGLRPILAWFARAFPHDTSIRASLARVMRGEDEGLAGRVREILGRAVVPS